MHRAPPELFPSHLESNRTASLFCALLSSPPSLSRAPIDLLHGVAREWRGAGLGTPPHLLLGLQAVPCGEACVNTATELGDGLLLLSIP
jgi:hypothetical protein